MSLISLYNGSDETVTVEIYPPDTNDPKFGFSVDPGERAFIDLTGGRRMKLPAQLPQDVSVQTS